MSEFREGVITFAKSRNGYPEWVRYVETYACSWRSCDHTKEVWRNASNRKEFGHKKYIYCANCKASTTHTKTDEHELEDA